MLMGFPLDHWNLECIHNAIGSFGKVLLWENDKSNLARLLMKARVTDLQDTPISLSSQKQRVFKDTPGRFSVKYWRKPC
jgi:hypothetical protein